MATSTIKTGLRLAKVDSSKFTWSSSISAFTYNYNSAVADTGLTTIVAWFVSSDKASGTIFGINANSANTIRVLGWIPKTGASIDGTTDVTSFSVYAIGY